MIDHAVLFYGPRQDMDHFKNQIALGKYLRDFHVKRTYRILMISMMLSMSVGIFILGYLLHNIEINNVHVSYYFFAICALLIFLAIYFYFYDRSLALHEHGFVWKTKFRELPISWSEIQEIRERKELLYGLLEASHTLKIKTTTGIKININTELQQPEELIHIVRSKTVPFLLARAESELNLPPGVVFDKLTITNDGLNRGTERLFWNDIERIVFSKPISSNCHLIQVYKFGSKRIWFKTAIPYFPNYDLFIALLNKYIPNKLFFPK